MRPRGEPILKILGNLARQFFELFLHEGNGILETGNLGVSLV